VSLFYDYVVVGLGGLGSATVYEISKRGGQVLGLEQFELGHAKGASHDTSRILRRSYHTPAYVRLAAEAYDDWAELERVSGEALVTVTGGLDLFPPGAAIPEADYIAAMAECGVPFERLEPHHVARRWPNIVLPEGGTALYQANTGIVHAARTTAVLQRLAASYGADLRDCCPVTRIAVHDSGEIEVTAGDTFVCRRLIVCADAWTNVLLAHLGEQLPLTVTREQVTYFEPERPEDFSPGRFPVWIWMDDPSFYGFPTYGGSAVKAGQDVGGYETTADGRDFEIDRANLDQLTSFMRRTFPGSAREAVRTVTCLYTLTPDRDFVIGALPRQPDVLVGLGAGHAFKFVPTIGRILADLAMTSVTSSDIADFNPDRDALEVAGAPVHWLV
jgi:sarcosine oxidase